MKALAEVCHPDHLEDELCAVLELVDDLKGLNRSLGNDEPEEEWLKDAVSDWLQDLRFQLECAQFALVHRHS